MDPYALLGVPRDADADTLKAAWRQAARTHHPDRGGDPEAFVALSRAWEILGDPLRRRFFDRFGQDPHELGLEGDALAEALRARLVGEEPRSKPPRAECPICEGTGWRPSGRNCNACDPTAMRTPPPTADYDPLANTGGQRVRVGRRTKPKARAPASASTPSMPENYEEPEKKHRFRLRPKKK